MEELLTQHRKEQRDLQSKITQKKKAASKKTRKGVNDECTRLEDKLKQKQATEIAALEGGKTDADREDGNMIGEKAHDEDEQPNDEGSTNGTTEALSSLSVAESKPAEEQSRKPNRQKARLARRAAEQAELAAGAEEEAKNTPDLRARERETMLAAFKARDLTEKEVRADGHCLYSAVADQLSIHNMGLQPKIMPRIIKEEDDSEKSEEPYRAVRRVTAEYIKTHADDFVPFLEEPLDEYVRKVGETGEWGGQLELLALAKAYGVKISVLDGNGSVHEIDGNDVLAKDEDKQIWLAYYRHGFGLGEHYNSLRKA